MPTPPDDFAVAILDSLPNQVVVIDSTGHILFVNRAWIDFGVSNGLPEHYSWVGRNYLAVCCDARDAGRVEALSALKGIRQVVSGERQRFAADYPCHSPDEQRWFTMHIVPMSEAPGLYVISHELITARVLAEQRVAEKNHALELAVITDDLTGLLNRPGLERFIRQEAKRSDRADSVFSLILADIDRFKTINDRFGHRTGDRVIRSVGKCLSTHSREYDAVGRWGGDEFLVVLPETDVYQAEKKAERLRIATQSCLPYLGESVSISYGTIQYQPGESIGNMMEAVDIALYQAKRNGRNQGRVHHHANPKTAKTGSESNFHSVPPRPIPD